MPTLRFGQIRHPRLGAIWVAETDAGVAAATAGASPEPMLAALGRRFPDATADPGAVRASLDADDDVPTLDLRGLPPFDARVYEAVVTIPRGETATYGEVAARLGSPRAARAVGRAMARCPLFPVVPCHRVVRASDGWSGWGGDPALKRGLLDGEAAELTGGAGRDEARAVRRADTT